MVNLTAKICEKKNVKLKKYDYFIIECKNNKLYIEETNINIYIIGKNNKRCVEITPDVIIGRINIANKMHFDCDGKYKLVFNGFSSMHENIFSISKHEEKQNTHEDIENDPELKRLQIMDRIQNFGKLLSDARNALSDLVKKNFDKINKEIESQDKKLYEELMKNTEESNIKGHMLNNLISTQMESSKLQKIIKANDEYKNATQNLQEMWQNIKIKITFTNPAILYSNFVELLEKISVELRNLYSYSNNIIVY